MSERVFTFPTYDLAQSILGQHNRYLQMMNEVIPADIVSRGDTVVIKGRRASCRGVVSDIRGTGIPL